MLELHFALSFALLGLVTLTQRQRDDEAEDRRAALQMAGLSQAEAARIMRMDRCDLNNALAGLQKLDAWRWEMLPPSVHQFYALRKLQRHGVPELVKVGVKALPTLLDMGRKESA